MVKAVDDDGSGAIEFPEFLSIIKNGAEKESTRAITDFFKNMTTGKYGNVLDTFDLFVNSERRKTFFKSIECDNEEESENAKRIRDNCRRQVKLDKEADRLESLRKYNN
jgi:ribosome recycling factor